MWSHYRFHRSGRRNALGVDRGGGQRADEADQLFAQVDRGETPFPLVATTNVPPKIESGIVTDQRARFIDPRTNCRYVHLADQLSRSARLRSAFRARLIAAARSRARLQTAFHNADAASSRDKRRFAAFLRIAVRPDTNDMRYPAIHTAFAPCAYVPVDERASPIADTVMQIINV